MSEFYFHFWKSECFYHNFSKAGSFLGEFLKQNRAEAEVERLKAELMGWKQDHGLADPDMK